VTGYITDRPASWQACTGCGEELLESSPAVRCPSCGDLLAVHHRSPDLPGEILRALWQTRCCTRPDTTASGVWRFQEVILPSAGADRVSHPEGNTPMLFRQPLSDWAGLPWLGFKHEGHNPTGSFKDRGMTVAVTQARRIGARALACASTGNTAASLAAYAAQAGIPAVVLMPEGHVSAGKLAQAIAYGARVLQVRGDFDSCLRVAEEAGARHGVYLVNSINPFRIEGQKTIVLELLQQLGWEVPDWIVVPAGNLGNTAAFGKALEEALAWGLISRLPRVVAVQAEGAAPFARSFAAGFAVREPVVAETVATAIRIGDPASWSRAVHTIRLTNGLVTAVSDAAILEAKARIDAAGVGCEPASAATLAAIRQLVAAGTIQREDRVVAILTGHLLKDPDAIMDFHLTRRPPPPGANPPTTIAADADAVAGALRL
jgi:threonine synthase